MNITASMVKDLREASGAGMMDCKKALQEANGNMDEAINYLREKGIAKSLKKESRIAAEGLASIYQEDAKAIILEVNSETDFVSKNDEFKEMIEIIGTTLLKANPENLDDALSVKYEDGTIADFIINKTAKIGEKLSLRRFEIVEKTKEDTFGVYIHMGGKIASLVLIKGNNEEVAKDVAMQEAAMKPLFVFPKDVPDDVLDNEKMIAKEQALNEGKTEEIANKMVDGKIKKYYKENCLTEQVFIKDDKISVNEYLKKNNCELLKVIRYEVGEGMAHREENFAEEVMNQIK